MTMTTKRGYELAMRLNPFIGTTTRIAETCSLLTRHARTYSGVQERWCNEEMGERLRSRLEAREGWLEARISDLVTDLPQPDDGPWKVQFEGDPRAWTVRLIAPDGTEIGVDD